MAQTGYTPISIYYSSTTTNVPTAGNLVAGELAINTNDGVLYYKDSSGVVQSIASKAGNSGSFTNLSYTGTLTGGTGIVNLGSGQLYKDASGNVGIGTSSPTLKLSVGVNAGVNGINHIYTGTGGPSNIATWTSDVNTGEVRFGGVLTGYFPTFYSSGSERMRIATTGHLLVGTTIDTATVISQSSANDLFGGYNGANGKFSVSNVGTIYAINTTVQSYSDERLKENIRDSEDGLNIITALKPRRFDWKEGRGNGKKDQLGFVAQEFEQVFPEAVDAKVANYDENIEYKTVGASALIPVLVKAMQEQQAMIETMQSKLKDAGILGF